MCTMEAMWMLSGKKVLEKGLAKQVVVGPHGTFVGVNHVTKVKSSQYLIKASLTKSLQC